MQIATKTYLHLQTDAFLVYKYRAVDERGNRDNAERIYSYFSMKTYIVTSH